MKLHKLSALSVALVSCTYLTACSTPQALHNTHANAELPNTSTFKYPATRTHEGSEDRFLSGEFGLSENTAASSNRFHTPETHRPDDGVDKHHNGVYVDKYRWLEDYDPINPNLGKETNEDRERNVIGTLHEDDRPLAAEKTKFLQTVPPKTSSEVNTWVDEQNKFSENYIHNVPIYENLKKNSDSLKYAYHEYSKTERKGVGEFRYYRDSEGYKRVELTREDGTVVDLVNEKDLAIPEKGIVGAAMGGFKISKEGSYISFWWRTGRADADTVFIRVIDTKTGQIATPDITATAANATPSHAWVDDETLMYGAVGLSSPWRPDIYTRKIGKEGFLDKVELTLSEVDSASPNEFSLYGDDKRYIVVKAWEATDLVYIKDRQTGKTYRIYDRKFWGKNARHKSFNNTIASILVHFDPKTRDVYFISGENDARGELIKSNLDNLKKREVVVPAHPEFDLMRDGVVHAEGDGYYAISWLHNGVARVMLIDSKGQVIKEITPPEGAGFASEFSSHIVGEEKSEDGKEKDDENDNAEANENYIKFRYSNPTLPETDYKYSISKDTYLDVRRYDLTPFDHTQYETKTVKYKSYDGTEVGMNISYKKGIKLDGNNPTILYGYGGYGVIYDQGFGFPIMTEWLENGGVWAHAFIRGGGEHGDKWQQAAQHINRPIGYDDFAAAADYLNEKGYARPDKMGIIGASNGGKLVGAEMVRHPGKYAVALPGVGVLDVYRHEKMGVTQYWMGESGTPEESKTVAEAIRTYSPQHNLHKGVCYPATLVWASKRDDRVVPSHSYKFAAGLQEVQSCNRPVLLWNGEDAGHSPSTYHERNNLNLNIMAFAFNEMGVKSTEIIKRPTADEMKTPKWRAEEAAKAARKAAKKAKEATK